jgi:D-alanyl-D-alanine carboxypeptidase/D-alanyl-D-alanine-endopeptidase (penicillin-binding protein 4)
MRALLAIALLAAAFAAPGSGAPPTAPDGPLAAGVNAVVGREPHEWGVLAVSLADGQTLFSHNADALFLPASNQKVLTTAAALDALGPYWTTRTSLYATARPDGEGVVRGDLVLYGRGDPNLSGRFSSDDPLAPLRALAARVREAGVARVEGALVADDSYLTGPPTGAGWTYNDLQRWFGAEVSALSFNDNLVNVVVTPGARAGDPCAVRLDPDVGYVTVNCEVTAVAGGGSKIKLRRDPDTARVDVSGTLRAGGAEWTGAASVRHPALYAAAAFRRALAEAGVEVAGPTRRLGPYAARPPELELDRMTELASIPSLPLSELVRVVNKESQNLHAELLLRLLGRERGPQDLPHDEAGLAVVSGFLERVGAAASGMRLRDGSGLSRLDRMTPRMLEGVLRAMDSHPSGSFFWGSLSEAGVDGTLRYRLRRVRLRGKTGSLEAAKSLTGYLGTEAGERLAVCVLYNDPAGTGDGVRKIDRIVTAIASREPATRAAAGRE